MYWYGVVVCVCAGGGGGGGGVYACVYLNGQIAIILWCVYFTKLLHCVVGPICQAWW